MKKITYLKEGWYRESEIPKKGNKVRKIVCPSVDLLEYQKDQLSKLSKIYSRMIEKTNIKNTAHGFIPDRNCVSAAIQHIGYDTTIVIDIKDFFDDVKKEMFNKKSTIYLQQDENLFHEDGYCAQGFSTSPMMANLAIIDTLKEIKEYLDKFYKEHSFTIYADDIQISINNEQLKDKYLHENQIIFKIASILERHGFKINSNKTRVLRQKFGYRKILGINVGKDHIRATRQTMKKIRAAKHQKNGQSLGGLITWSRCMIPKKLRK
jgi:2C-methyl-D-erythritol 2,4-cyclodiphosphate synthase